MKQIYFSVTFILTTFFAFAQIPADYYDSANGLSGFTLKTELRNITANGHTARTYDQLYDGSGVSGSQGYVDTHSDAPVSSGNVYENDGTVLDFYSENPTGTDPYNFTHNVDEGGNQNSEGDCYNREHLVPQSSFGSGFPMQSDIHHVIPTDCRVNNFRSSYPFANVASATWTSQNGSKRGSSAAVGYSGVVFEPIDEFKGDIARALLYFATRYENTIDGYTSFDMFNGSNDQVFFPWAINTLLDWHYNVDPVDQRERDRNNAAYNFQGNANPFVDHPEYANLIWNPVADTEAPTNPTNLTASNPTDNSVSLSWTASTDNVAVASYNVYIDNVFAFNTSNTSINATGLTQNTNYCFTVTALDTTGNESNMSNQACEMTTDNGSTGGNVDLFFSEYIEGSSFNKVLEVANFTGANVTDLSAYTIKLGTNGGGSWGTIYTFPANATIANQDVFVIANGSSSVCTTEYDDLNTDITSFNGNDALGLFKNDILIDIIGDLNSDADFGKEVTLVRKPEITTPSTTYDSNQWNSFAQNECSDLGSHTQTLSVVDYNLNTIKIYPNPISGNKLTVTSKETVTYSIFDILGKRIAFGTIKNQEINISSLKKGLYLIKLETDSGSVTKKLIRQ